MSKYKMEIICTKKIMCPEYGSSAYRTESVHEYVSFGKGTNFATGKEALKVAIDLASERASSFYKVEVYKVNGCTGRLVYEKQEEGDA